MTGVSNERASAFFRFMEKREQLRLNKAAGQSWPWSDDAILNTYKFTNVKREHDRTTMWMRKHWTQPHDNSDAGEIIFNCGLFRYFGTIEFAEAIGWQQNWNPESVSAVASQRHASKLRVFTGAYIIPTMGLKQVKHEVVCRLILSPLWLARHELAIIAQETKSWRRVGERLMCLPGFGGTGFMAKEMLQDVMHTRVLRNAVDRNSWCPAGPGACRGLNRLHDRPVTQGIPFDKALAEMIELFSVAKPLLANWMPELELHDIQFQLCEFDKYERVRTGEGRPKARYTPPGVTRQKDLFACPAEIT
jgi:hypothetical protein